MAQRGYSKRLPSFFLKAVPELRPTGWLEIRRAKLTARDNEIADAIELDGFADDGGAPRVNVTAAGTSF